LGTAEVLRKNDWYVVAFAGKIPEKLAIPVVLLIELGCTMLVKFVVFVTLELSNVIIVKLKELLTESKIIGTVALKANHAADALGTIPADVEFVQLALLVELVNVGLPVAFVELVPLINIKPVGSVKFTCVILKLALVLFIVMLKI
jgi:hypothetical protein